MVLCNICLFVVVVAVLIRHYRSLRIRQVKDTKHRRSIITLFISILGIMSLFGISWVFAALMVTLPAIRLPAQVIFAIFSSFQGLGLFVFFCIVNRDARESWKEALSCGRYTSKFLHPSKFGIRTADQRIHAVGTMSTKIVGTLKLEPPLNNPYKPNTSLTQATMNSCQLVDTGIETNEYHTSTSQLTLTSPDTSTKSMSLPTSASFSGCREAVTCSSDLPLEGILLQSLPPSTNENSAPSTGTQVLKPSIKRTTTLRQTHDVEMATLDFHDDTDQRYPEE